MVRKFAAIFIQYARIVARTHHNIHPSTRVLTLVMPMMFKKMCDESK